MTGPATRTVEMFDVQLTALPVASYLQWRERTEDLVREFRLIALNSVDAASHSVPRRLLELVDSADITLAAVTDPVASLAEDALRSGGVLDLRYQLPYGAEHAALRLGLLLDEADDYCERGKLLTLAATPELRALRWWQFSEIVRQRHGLAPSPFCWRG